MKIILIACLGNPGKEYEKTRHNAGFMFADYFWENFRKEFNFSDWKFKKRLNAKISVGKTEEKKIILLKPQTFMNLSGQAVSEAMKYFIQNKTCNSLIVIHDEIDLPLGSFRFSKDSSSAGHKGVQNIIDQLDTKNFTRLRIGIENHSKFTSQTSKKKTLTEKYVLKKFANTELKILKKTLETSSGELIDKIKK